MSDREIIYAIIFITLIILLLIAGIAIVVIVANRRHVQQEIKMTQMKIEYEKELRTVEQEVQEQMLTNVSQELHDNIGQMLTVMHLQLKKGQILHPDVTPLLQPVSNTLNDTIEQVKTLARGLNSDMIRRNGLEKSIAQEAARIATLERFTVNYQYNDSPVQLAADAQLLIFRIFQEMLNNIMKHAEATQVDIRLEGSPFLLEVKDNGKGFDPETKLYTGKGMGLANMVKRAKLAGMDCEILSSAGKGCIFILKQP